MKSSFSVFLEFLINVHNLLMIVGWHTAGINVLGSFVLGGVFGSPLVDSSISATVPSKQSITQGLTPRMKLLIGVGFCGSFTTFSTFSVEVVNMISRGETAKAASYVAATNLGGLSAAACGIMLAKKIFHL